jgi:hypothetical protein
MTVKTLGELLAALEELRQQHGDDARVYDRNSYDVIDVHITGRCFASSCTDVWTGEPGSACDGCGAPLVATVVIS